MPRMDGLELCRKLRSRSETLPIIFLTSRDEEIDRILGLEMGADDYLCKPFSMRELIARIKVLFRRQAFLQDPKSAGGEEPFRHGPLELDLQRYSVRWKGIPVSLTVTEFMMLHALVRYPGHVKTRKQLHQDGSPHDPYVTIGRSTPHKSLHGSSRNQSFFAAIDGVRRRIACGPHLIDARLSATRPGFPSASCVQSPSLFLPVASSTWVIRVETAGIAETRSRPSTPLSARWP